MIDFDEGRLEGRVSDVAGGLVAAAGLISLATGGIHLSRESLDVAEIMFGVGLPALLSVALTGVGIRIFYSDLDDDYAFRLTMWWLVGLTVTAVMAIVMILYQHSHGATIVDASHVVINNMTAGSLGGLIVGYYNVQTRKQAEQLQEQVTELEAERERAEQQREQLEILNRIVRHDIRNDLAVIQGRTELAIEHTNDEGRTHLEKVIRSANDAIDLTETAREFVQTLEAEDEEQDLKPVNLIETLHGQLDRTEQAHPEVEIHTAFPDTPVLVRANDMLSSVFRNLLVNAVQHNYQDRPEVHVRVENCDDIVRVTVADNGPGIPDERKEEIFGRGEKGLESGGSGIGLYLVDQLVTQYGGSVQVKDNDPGGAVFTIQLRPA